jgi:hypothetical protein
VKSEAEIRAEIEAVRKDIETCGDDYQFKSYLSTVFNTLQWVLGSLSTDELIIVLEEEANFWGSD